MLYHHLFYVLHLPVKTQTGSRVEKRHSCVLHGLFVFILNGLLTLRQSKTERWSISELLVKSQQISLMFLILLGECVKLQTWEVM